MNKRKDVIPKSLKEQWKNNKLKELRLVRGLTQKQVAELLQLKCEDRLSHWERGQAMPSVVNLMKVAKVLKVPVHDLL